MEKDQLLVLRPWENHEDLIDKTLARHIAVVLRRKLNKTWRLYGCMSYVESL